MLVLAFLGLRQVAVAMSDPFGDDEVDFNLEAMQKEVYNNAIAFLADRRPMMKSALPKGMKNPLAQATAESEARFPRFPMWVEKHGRRDQPELAAEDDELGYSPRYSPRSAPPKTRHVDPWRDETTPPLPEHPHRREVALAAPRLYAQNASTPSCYI